MNRFLFLIVKNNSLIQFFRYGLVGVASNLIGYAVYLLITYAGASPKITMTLLYCIGASLSYWGNRKLTFSDNSGLLQSSIRYFAVYFLGYLINLSLLMLLVDKLGYPHQWIQGIAVLLVSIFLFFALKFFVFAGSRYH